MTSQHDPFRQATSLSEVLAQAKRPLGFFLTAGCPYAIKAGDPPGPLLPDIVGLTEAIRRALKAGLATDFDTACKSLEADTGKAPNIEDVLSYLRSIRLIVGMDTVRGFNAGALDALDDAISKCIVTTVDVELPEGMTPFDDLAKWLGSTARAFPVELFTTNYDLLIEQAFERTGVPFFDGFVGVRRAFFDQRSIEEDILSARWARLWKLHGSINWQLDGNGRSIRSVVPSAKNSPLIHPSHLKYSESRRMPYLAMIDRLRTFLKQPSSFLTVCGYSFHDQHLNEVLLQGVQTNPTSAIFALQYGLLESYPEASKLARVCSNFNVLAADKAVLGAREAPWSMPEPNVLTAVDASAFWRQELDPGGEIVGGEFILGDFVNFGKFLFQLTSAGKT